MINDSTYTYLSPGSSRGKKARSVQIKLTFNAFHPEIDFLTPIKYIHFRLFPFSLHLSVGNSRSTNAPLQKAINTSNLFNAFYIVLNSYQCKVCLILIVFKSTIFNIPT